MRSRSGSSATPRSGQDRPGREQGRVPSTRSRGYQNSQLWSDRRGRPCDQELDGSWRDPYGRAQAPGHALVAKKTKHLGGQSELTHSTTI